MTENIRDGVGGQNSSAEQNNTKVGLQRPKSSARPINDLATDDFADLDISPDFQPIKPAAKASRDDDYKVAMTGPAAFMDPAPEKIQPVNKVENSQVTDSPVSVESSVVESSDVAVEATTPQRSKLPIYAAIAASLVCVAVLGANSWPTATASGEANGTDFAVAKSAAFGSVASLPTQVLEQQGVALSGNNGVDDSVGSSSTNSAVYSQGTHVAIALPANINDSAPIDIASQPALQPLAAPKAEFTPLKSGTTKVAEDYEGLSRSDCAARFKTVALSGAINFESGSATLLRSSQPILNFFGAVFEHCRHFTIEVAGHTDSVGSANMNQELSEQRAESVAEYLVSIGVPDQNLRAVGYGEAAPIASNDTALKRSRNRRIEFTISDG